MAAQIRILRPVACRYGNRRPCLYYSSVACTSQFDSLQILGGNLRRTNRIISMYIGVQKLYVSDTNDVLTARGARV
jgi:hypothetical protein